jgi:methionyl-tRNA formyltransferase
MMKPATMKPSTMEIDASHRESRFALFLNGSNFACEVLQALQQSNVCPTLLVLPEYPPAMRKTTKAGSAGEMLTQTLPRSRLLQPGNIEIAYAPRAQQVQCAHLLRERRIEFILVACWPYLIDRLLLESATLAAVNLHPSLLPAYRGPDPIGAQLSCAELHPGVSLHLLNSQFDRGDIVAQAELEPGPSDCDRACLERRCAVLGSELFIDALNGYDAGWKLVSQLHLTGDLTDTVVSEC